ncbi:uncharacterized protein LOC106177645 [Lingula anatina]|uniref:Uncharacterized protein LOC106177645 n=1 Tax=Lingula anatina TaxID=7574 RepID=A0A1S3JZX8_LINAN|nr:uncharacterized protein LOC106177645 [Lingula anatina]|eukprot:XP_013415938.1 uncharacterized protein LOC106177645 [Lingula anatina]
MELSGVLLRFNILIVAVLILGDSNSVDARSLGRRRAHEPDKSLWWYWPCHGTAPVAGGPELPKVHRELHLLRDEVIEHSKQTRAHALELQKMIKSEHFSWYSNETITYFAQNAVPESLMKCNHLAAMDVYTSLQKWGETSLDAYKTYQLPLLSEAYDCLSSYAIHVHHMDKTFSADPLMPLSEKLKEKSVTSKHILKQTLEILCNLKEFIYGTSAERQLRWELLTFPRGDFKGQADISIPEGKTERYLMEWKVISLLEKYMLGLSKGGV